MTSKKAPSHSYLHSIDPVFTGASDAFTVPLHILTAADYEDMHARASASFSRQMEQSGFQAKDKQVCILRDEQGAVVEILIGSILPLSLYAFSYVHEKLKSEFSADFLSRTVFRIEGPLRGEDIFQACAGWALASYKFDLYKKDKSKGGTPVLLWPEGVDRKRVTALVEGLCLIKTLINIPSNRLGTDELADAAAHIARQGRGSFLRIVDKDLIEQNFPMIYEVGKASPRRPQLIDINWGNDEHPRLTLVGKGVVFDTGGLDLKPPPFMLLMKKDMGGSAHVLALAHIIMSLNLPVRLRVLISAAENSVGGESFRPGDVLNSRKGLTVEVGDTDAEGRLVVAEALTYACEGDSKPDLLIDFCTLTGSARAALGYDIPAFFSNKDTLLDELKTLGQQNEDPVWPLPLWQPYLKEMSSSVADLNNIGSGKAGAIHGGLFLQQFIDPSVDWIHMDCYAWEQSGKPGRPAGGADTGLRAVLKLIEKRYAA
jgi:leucyl aminopeptidase